MIMGDGLRRARAAASETTLPTPLADIAVGSTWEPNDASLRRPVKVTEVCRWDNGVACQGVRDPHVHVESSAGRRRVLRAALFGSGGRAGFALDAPTVPRAS